MSAFIRNHIVKDEIPVTPSDSVNLTEGYRDGFRVGTGGDVSFTYQAGSAEQEGNTFTRTFNSGDEWFGKIIRINAAGTTATNITAFRLD